MSRDKLMAHLWPERDAESARNLLKVAVHELRKALDDNVILSTGDQVHLDPALLPSDVADFEAAIAAKDYERAAALYAGPFLDGFYMKDSPPFERWVDGERARLAQTYTRAIDALADTAEKRGDAPTAVRWLQALAAHDPLRTDVALRLMRAMAASGDRIGAIRHAGIHTQLRREDIAVEPDPAIAQLAREIADTPSRVATIPAPDLVIAARSSDPADGRVVARRTVNWPVAAAGAAGVIGAVAIIAMSVASRDDSPTAVAARLARDAKEQPERIADLSTRPLVALRAYLDAQSAYRDGQYPRAESLFARALAADTTFALAGFGLALANSWNTISEHYGIGRDAAVRWQASLTPRDREFLRAYFGPDPQFAPARPAPTYLSAWELLVQKWPDWSEAWYHLGDRYYHFGGLSGLGDPLDNAHDAFARSMQLDEKLIAPLHHMLEIQAARGDRDQLRRTGERYFRLHPSVKRDASATGWMIATVLGDAAWAERVRRNYDAMPPSDLARIVWIAQANGWREARADAERALDVLERKASVTWEHVNAQSLRFAYATNAGDHAGARAAGARLQQLLPDEPISALWDLYGVLFGDADSTRGAQAVRGLQRFATGPVSGIPDRQGRQYEARCLVAYWKLRAGNTTGARDDLRALQRLLTGVTPAGPARDGHLCAAWVAAALAVAVGADDAAGLVAKLDTMVLSDRVPPRIALSAAGVMSARLHEQMGQPELALASSRWREHYTGHPYFLATQLAMEARLAQRAGDAAGAARARAHLQGLR